MRIEFTTELGKQEVILDEIYALLFELKYETEADFATTSRYIERIKQLLIDLINLPVPRNYDPEKAMAALAVFYQDSDTPRVLADAFAETSKQMYMRAD